MSASNEKKTGQARSNITSWSNPRTAREAEKMKEERRSNILYATIGVVFLLVAISVFVWKSNVIQKHATAVTIHGENYTAAEVNYYFNSVYQNFVNSNYQYLSYLGLSTSTPLRDQSYGNDGKTWFDYFLDQALSQMSSVAAMNDAAAKDGFTWTDDLQSQLDSTVSSMEASATKYGYSNPDQYLKKVYGSTMSESLYKAELKRALLAQAYSQKYQDSLTYTTAQLTDAYNKDPNSYDAVDYESVLITGSPATTDSSGNTVDVTDQMKSDALATAKETANSIYSDYKGGKTLSSLADENKDIATYTDGTGGSYSDSVLMNWLYDTTRASGDSTVLFDEANSNYYVVVFHNRYRYDYSTVDVRHILIQPETGTLTEGEDGYDAEQAKLKADAKTKAEDLLSQWKSGAATEDSFAELAKANSSDTGSASDGGLYKQVYKGEMVTAFNDWCFDSARKTGDTGVVETDYGYHVMYFVGTDLPYWQVQVTNALKNNDYSTWYTGLTKDYTAEQHSFGVQFVD